MFHTERTFAIRQDIFTKRPAPFREEDPFPHKLTKNKHKNTMSRNRKLSSTSSPFVDLKKQLLYKQNFYKSSLQSLAASKKIKASSTLKSNNTYQKTDVDYENISNAKSHPMSMFLKLNTNDNQSAKMKANLESSARNKFHELASDKKKNNTSLSGTNQHSKSVRMFLEEQQIIETKKKPAENPKKYWGRYFPKSEALKQNPKQFIIAQIDNHALQQQMKQIQKLHIQKKTQAVKPLNINFQKKPQAAKLTNQKPPKQVRQEPFSVQLQPRPFTSEIDDISQIPAAPTIDINRYGHKEDRTPINISELLESSIQRMQNKKKSQVPNIFINQQQIRSKNYQQEKRKIQQDVKIKNANKQENILSNQIKQSVPIIRKIQSQAKQTFEDSIDDIQSIHLGEQKPKNNKNINANNLNKNFITDSKQTKKQPKEQDKPKAQTLQSYIESRNHQNTKPAKSIQSKEKNIFREQLPIQKNIKQEESQYPEDIYLDYIQKHLDLVDLMGEYYKVAQQSYASIQYPWQINSFWIYKKFAFQRDRILSALRGGENCFVLQGMSIPDQKLIELIELDEIKEYAQQLDEQVQQIKQGLIERNKKACEINAKLKSSMDLSADPYSQCIRCLGQEFIFLNKLASGQPNNKGVHQRLVYICELIFILQNLHGNHIKQWQQMNNQPDIQPYKKYLTKYKSLIQKIIKNI